MIDGDLSVTLLQQTLNRGRSAVRPRLQNTAPLTEARKSDKQGVSVSLGNPPVQIGEKTATIA